MTDDDDTKDGGVSEEDVLEMNESEDEDESEGEGEEDMFNDDGTPRKHYDDFGGMEE